MLASNRVAVRAALLADLPARVNEVVATIREQIPAYAALSADQLAEVTAITSWGIERVLDLWIADQDLSPADLRRFRGIGSARALDGRPLPGVLRAYRLAGRAITQMVTSTAGKKLTVADAMALADLWMAAIDGLSEALTEGHTAATDRTTDDRERALADFLTEILAGRQVALTALADRSRQLGITVPAHPTVHVLAAGTAAGLAAQTLNDLLASVNLAGAEAALRIIQGRRGVVVTDSAGAATVASAARAHAMRGCAVEAARPRDLHRAYRLADLTLDLAPDHAYHQRPILDEGDAQVLALLAANPLADPARAVTCVLKDATSPDHAHLLEGLDAFLTHGSATAAAQHLNLHPQTMRYRLRRLHQLTGRNLRQPWDRFVLEAATRATARDH